ncbi:hypothetical protein, unlikely [Trypanosoma brucei gambiense DAL972]|uniref:Uncharacterized protein n=1 Tax=Trypanosoma brucei gambiense (strain MHOM/CI/86/DAL972) TaxID=679716 RepID=C9ZJ98_TRYB9|nr:hypothetical protein, unlikely [Trypanosoma brucei gambiense DAL972]CBH09457.1 hypothetical protein, unlikely [Trypanosoma brucei gambiense DAL972]|eukprot:XP_011771762.1 hypothetical protein, unlikely [Trypanosoma brucei gambiense DAL972]
MIRTVVTRREFNCKKKRWKWKIIQYGTKQFSSLFLQLNSLLFFFFSFFFFKHKSYVIITTITLHPIKFLASFFPPFCASHFTTSPTVSRYGEILHFHIVSYFIFPLLPHI